MYIPASFTGVYFAKGAQSEFLFPKEKPAGLNAYVSLFCKYLYISTGSAVGAAGFVYHSTQSIRCSLKGSSSEDPDFKKEMALQSLRHRNVAFIDLKKIGSTLFPTTFLLSGTTALAFGCAFTALGVYSIGIEILVGVETGNLLTLGVLTLLFGGVTVFGVKMASYLEFGKLFETALDQEFQPSLEETRYYFNKLAQYNNVVPFTDADINEFDRRRLEKGTKEGAIANAVCDFNTLREMNKVTARRLEAYKEYQDPVPGVNAADSDYSQALKNQITWIFRRTEL